MSHSDRAFMRAFRIDFPQPQLQGPHLPAEAWQTEEDSQQSEPVSTEATAVAEEPSEAMSTGEVPLPTIAEEPAETAVDTQTVSPERELEASREEEAETTRRPLSDLVAEQPQIDTAFRPAFEVDHFRWPQVIEQLFSEYAGVADTLVEQVLSITEKSGHVLGFVGKRAQIGVSTLVLAAARGTAEAGCRVAVVDANREHPTLGASLGLAPGLSWERYLNEGESLADVVVHSLRDGISLLPLTKSEQPESWTEPSQRLLAAAGMDVLRESYDLVLVDLGCPRQDAPCFDTGTIPVSLVVDDGMPSSEDIQPKRVDAAPTGDCMGIIMNRAA